MADNNKKRVGSLRKLFPFFSKSKDKNTSQDTQTRVKMSTSNPFASYQYQNPRAVLYGVANQSETENEDRIYENLSTVKNLQQHIDNESNGISSNHSSISTLVSESVKNNAIGRLNESEAYISQSEDPYAARPQVPRKPLNDFGPSTTIRERSGELGRYHYPNVYYHSIEKLANDTCSSPTSPVDNEPQTQADLRSVGAQIKKVSTKFLISPKKEAEVRTIQPTRARSLSFSNNNVKQRNNHTEVFFNNSNPKRTYNYSAPTSPIPVNNKNPAIPKTISTYEHVRKKIKESEENKTSKISNGSLAHGPLNTQIKNKLTPTADIELNDKEKTRQKVEAFYWKSLKEMKEKEDEYFLKQALSPPVRYSPVILPQSNYLLNATPSYSVVMKTNSLPRRKDINPYETKHSLNSDSPFRRMAPERRTDSFIEKKNLHYGPEIVLRNPEKLKFRMSPMNGRLTPICQTHKALIQQPKRVSFEESLQSDTKEVDKDLDYNSRVKPVGIKPSEAERRSSKCPPRPPMRTTSVSSAEKNYRLLNNQARRPGQGYSLCSESESGSEAGEIQRILQSTAYRESRFYNTVTKDHRQSWKCQLCRSKESKLDNKNTAIRTHSDINIKSLTTDHNVNTTQRRKIPRFSEDNSTISDDDYIISPQANTPITILENSIYLKAASLSADESKYLPYRDYSKTETSSALEIGTNISLVQTEITT